MTYINPTPAHVALVISRARAELMVAAVEASAQQRTLSDLVEDVKQVAEKLADALELLDDIMAAEIARDRQ